MKKILLSVSLLCASLSMSWAQQTSIGITGGAGLAWISNSAQDLINKPSWNLGATLVYSSASHWGFGADVKYSREGMDYNSVVPLSNIPFISNNTNLETHVSSDFIRIPLRVIYFFNDNDHNVRPNISVGPSFGFLTGGQIKVLRGDNVFSTAPVSDSFKSFDFGVQGSVGLSFKLAESLWLSTDVAYYQGLLKQNKIGDDNMMNSNLVLNLGLRIGIGN